MPALFRSTIKPTFIASCGGIALYEHPVHGDEAPLVIKKGGDLYMETDFWDLPDAEDMRDFMRVN